MRQGAAAGTSGCRRDTAGAGAGAEHRSTLSTIEGIVSAAASALDAADDRPVSTTALVLVTGIGPFCTDAYLPALPAVQRALATSAAVAQLTVTGFLAGLAVGQLVSGPVSDGRGRRRLLLAAAVLLVLTSVLCALAPTGWSLVALRFVQGLAAGTGAAVGTAVVADRYRGADAAARYGTLASIRLIGPVIAPAIGGAILLRLDYRGVFAFMAALGLLVLVLCALGIPETLPVHRRQPTGPAGVVGRNLDLLRDRAFVRPVVVQCLTTAGFFVYIGGSSFVLQRGLAISPGLYAVVFATDAAAMVVASATFRVLVRRTGPERLRRIGLIMSVGGELALLLVAIADGGEPPLVVAWVLLAVAVAGNGFCIPATTVLAQEAGRRSSGTAASLSGGLSFLVGALTTPLTGLLGVTTVAGMALLMVVLSAVALVAASLPRRRA